MRLVKLMGLAAAVLVANGCTSLNMNTNDKYEIGEPEIVDYHLNMGSIDEFDGNLLQVDLLGGQRRKGEAAFVGIWPLGGVGVGPFGAYLKILPVELGLSFLLYDVDGSQNAE